MDIGKVVLSMKMVVIQLATFNTLNLVLASSLKLMHLRAYMNTICGCGLLL